MRFLLCALGAAFLTSGIAFAQSDRGAITGTVIDQAGAVVPNAKVQATRVETGVNYQTTTTDKGDYTIGELPVGSYEVTVNVPGFKKYIRQNLQVQVALTLRVDAALQIGTASESITVTEAAPLLNTESGDISHTVTVRNLDDLPILGIGAGQAGSAGIRNPYAMVELVPGTMWQANAQVR